MFFMVMQLAELTFEKDMWLILSPLLGKTGFPQLPKEETHADLVICLGGVTNFSHFSSPRRQQLSVLSCFCNDWTLNLVYRGNIELQGASRERSREMDPSLHYTLGEILNEGVNQNVVLRPL